MADDRYTEIIERLTDLDNQSIENQNKKDSAISAFRKKQKSILAERTSLNEELIDVIKSDPQRSRLYQT